MACPPEACVSFEPPDLVEPPPALPPYPPPPDPVPDPPPEPPPAPDPPPPPQAASTEAPAAPTPRAVPRRMNLPREILSSTTLPSSVGYEQHSLIRMWRGHGSRSLSRGRAYTYVCVE